MIGWYNTLFIQCGTLAQQTDYGLITTWLGANWAHTAHRTPNQSNNGAGMILNFPQVFALARPRLCNSELIFIWICSDSQRRTTAQVQYVSWTQWIGRRQWHPAYRQRRCSHRQMVGYDRSHWCSIVNQCWLVLRPIHGALYSAMQSTITQVLKSKWILILATSQRYL